MNDKKNATQTPADNPLAAGRAAAERVVEQLAERLQQQPLRLEVDDLIQRLRTHTARDIGPIELQARAVANQYANAVQRSGRNAVVSATIGTQLTGVLAAADQVFAEFDQEAELAAKLQELAEAERAQTETMHALEAAVAAGEVEEVLRQRTQLEVLVPQRIDAAKLAVLRLQAARTAQAGTATRDRAERASQQLASAQHAHDAAAKALKEAADKLTIAENQHLRADAAAAQVSTRLKKLNGQVAAAQADADRSRRERLGRMAGLTDDRPEPPQQAEPEPMLSRSPILEAGRLIR